MKKLLYKILKTRSVFMTYRPAINNSYRPMSHFEKAFSEGQPFRVWNF